MVVSGLGSSVSKNPEIIVVGGGIVGCAIAFELGRRGVRVQVIESRGVGQGATQASAGILAPFIEARPGSALWALGDRSLELFDDFVAQVVAASGTSIPYERSGTLELAVDESEWARLQRAQRSLQTVGVNCSLFDGEEAREKESQLAEAVQGALLVPSHGYVGAGILTDALRRAAAGYGVSFVAPRRVTRITSCSDGVMVDAAEGSVTGDAVVLAAGSWAGRVTVGMDEPVPVRPVRGQLVHLRWTGPPLARVLWSSRCYVVPWHDGSVLVGATLEEVGFNEQATVAGLRGLLEAAGEILPGTSDAGFDAVRVGLRPGTVDDLPVIGRSSTVPNVIYAVGHYRNGVLLSPLTATLVANLLLEDQSDPLLSTVAPERFWQSGTV